MNLFSYKNYIPELDQNISLAVRNLSYKPVLGIAQSGNYESSAKYIKIKREFCERNNIEVEILDMEGSVENAIKSFEKFIHSKSFNGIIIQLPLPKSNMYQMLDLIPYTVDVDMLSQKSKKEYYSGNFIKMPPVVRCVDFFLEKCDLKSAKGRAVIVGNGDLVGKPVAYYLEKLGFETVVDTNYTKGKKIDAKIVILGAGIPNLVDPKDITVGCNVVDLGSSVVAGKTVGDLDMTKGDESIEHLGYLAPSPGGLGPLTVRFLVMNLLNI